MVKKYPIDETLLHNIRLIAQKSEIEPDYIKHIENLVQHSNNFRATTSWVQQYEFAQAVVEAFALGARYERIYGV